MAALFANDGAALILTPIVIAMLLALKFSPAATLAFVMAAGFIADTASLPLVVSNLVNIVSADYFDIDFAAYASVMVPVNLVSVAASLGMLMWFFRRDIPGRYEVAELKHPRSAIVDSTTFNAGWAVLALLLAGFFGLGRIGVPISAGAGAGALVLVGVAARGARISTRKVIRGAPGPGGAGVACGGVLRAGAERRAQQRGGWRRRAGAAGRGGTRAPDIDPQGDPGGAVAGRGVFTGHVPSGLRPAQRGTDRPRGDIAGPVRRIRRVGRDVRDRPADRVPVLGHEQHADGAGRRAVHRRKPCRSEEHTYELQSLLCISYAVL